MRIDNTTPFSTERLRQIVQRVAEEELEPRQRSLVCVHFSVRGSRSKDARQAQRLGFYIRKTNHTGVLPEAGLVYNHAIVTIPKSYALQNPEWTAMSVAHQVAHEFAELRGYTHAQMRSPRYMPYKGWERLYQWAKELPLVLKPKKPGPSVDARRVRKLAHAQTMLAKAQTREKRAISIRRKWALRVRMYARLVNETVIRSSHENREVPDLGCRPGSDDQPGPGPDHYSPPSQEEAPNSHGDSNPAG